MRRDEKCYSPMKRSDRSRKMQIFFVENHALFSVNLFFALNEKLANLMKDFSEYSIQLEEIHHTHKKDAPSGTAITLAEGIIAETNKKGWKLDKANADEIPITAKRIDSVPGTHTIMYESAEDSIEIKHTAHSRQGFALGAVLASEWIKDKKGVFSMKDVLTNN